MFIFHYIHHFIYSLILSFNLHLFKEYSGQMDIATVVDEFIDPADLERFRKQYEDQFRRGVPNATVSFNYAHSLIKSTKEDVRIGIYVLEGLLKRFDSEMPKRDYVYYLAIAHTRIKEYDRALEYINLLLDAEGDNHQALDLKELIEVRMKRDGLLGMALTLGFGGVAVLGVAAAALMARKK